MASNLVWPDFTADRGRWRWVMQPVVSPLTGSATPPPLYVFEKNPNKMQSPFTDVSSSDSARNPYPDTDGLPNTVLLRTKYDIAEFTVDGKIWSKDQYDRMQAYYDWPGLVAIRDHFGRVFIVRIMNFDVNPVIPSATKPYKFEYKLSLQLWQFSESSGTVVENAANIGKTFNGFGPNAAMSLATFDATVARSYTVLERYAIPASWETISASDDWRNQWRTRVLSLDAVDETADRYTVLVLDVPADLLQGLAQGRQVARRTIMGIAEGLRVFLPDILWGEMSIALGVTPHITLQNAGLPLSTYAGAFRNFSSIVTNVSPRLVPVARYPRAKMASSTAGGMWAECPIACLYVRFTSSISLAETLDDMEVFRKNVYTRGSMFALTLSIGGATSDGKSPDTVLSQMYEAAQTAGPGYPRLAFFGYENYATYPISLTPPMISAYQGVYFGAETVTDELLGRI